MSTTHTMPNPQGRNHLAPPETLNVQGRGLSPQPVHDTTMLSVTSSARSSVSDDDDDEGSHQSEEYTVYDGVREMNHMLVKQIDTLRLKIQVDERNSERDKVRLREEKKKELEKKESEIEDLKDSLCNRDERIHGLVKAGHEKDKQIKSKSQEIETLKELVKQSEEYAQKLQEQISRVLYDKDRLKNDPLYQKQNEEMAKLTDELETLRERLASMEKELQRAMEIIDKQNEKMKTMLEEKSLIHAKFKEDLDRVSRAMRLEVERMREVMRQNYEEMRHLREENKQMHNDVRDIKEMLTATRTAGGSQNQDHYETLTGIQRPLTSHSSQLYIRHLHSQSKVMTPKRPGAMVGGNIAQTPGMRSQRNSAIRDAEASQKFQGPGRENTQMSRQGRSSFRSVNTSSTHYDTQQQDLDLSAPSGVRSSMDTARSNLSPDNSARPVNSRASNQRPHDDFMTSNTSKRQSPCHPNYVQQRTDGNDSKNFPPICTLKDGANLPGKRSASRPLPKSAVRKGSAVKRV